MWVAVLVACNGKEEPGESLATTDTIPGECDTDLTWENFGVGFFGTWCTGCHSEHLSGLDRQGAPEGMNFELVEDVRVLSDRIAARATPTPPTMPIAGGTTELERAHLEEWLSCGAPGENLPPAACSVLEEMAGDLVVSSEADATAFCDGPTNAVSGSVTVSAGVALDCLCEVQGDLLVSASSGEVSLAELREVAGDLHVEGAGRVDAWKLRAVGGAVVVSDTTMLTHFDARALVEIGGDLTLADNAMLTEPDLSRVLSVGGDVEIRGNALLSDLFVPTQSIVSVGGAIEVGQNPSLQTLGFLSVESVGGSIEVHHNDAMMELSGFTFGLAFADVSIHDNALLVELAGFDNARELSSLSIDDNPMLARVRGFVNLAEVSGPLAIRRSAVSDLGGLAAVQQVGELELQSLEIERLNGLETLEEVYGSLRVAGNPRLHMINQLSSVTRVGGDLAFEDNPKLESARVDLLASGMNVGGAIINAGNGP